MVLRAAHTLKAFTRQRTMFRPSALIENVRHHLEEEEESEHFPEVRSELDRKALTEPGDAMAKTARTAKAGTNRPNGSA
jgi:hypothetical protein